MATPLIMPAVTSIVKTVTNIASECQQKYSFQGSYIQGCVGVGTTGKFVCPLLNSSEWAFCSGSASRLGYVAAQNGTVPCNDTSQTGTGLTISGCYGSIGETYNCDTEMGTLPCVRENYAGSLKNVLTTSTSTAATANSPSTSPNQDITSPAYQAEQPSVMESPGFIAGVVGSAVVLAAIVFFFVYVRNKRNKAGNAYNEELMNGGASKESYADQPRAKMPRGVSFVGGLTDTSYRSREEPIGRYSICALYTPTLDDELAIDIGDMVEVFEEYDDGWCAVRNVTKGSARGVIPKYCIDYSS